MEKGKKNPHFGKILKSCTGTGPSCTSTDSVLFFGFDQRCILAITCSFMIRFE